LDANGNIIIDPKTNEPFLLTEKDTIAIAAPEFAFENHAWSSTATESIEVINVDREDLETIKTINKVVFYIELNDKAMQQAYDQGLFNVKLTNDNYLRVKLGVGASVEAVLNFDSVINQ
jgi:hypothetical protein